MATGKRKLDDTTLDESVKRNAIENPASTT